LPIADNHEMKDRFLFRGKPRLKTGKPKLILITAKKKENGVFVRQASAKDGKKEKAAPNKMNSSASSLILFVKNDTS